MSIARFILPAGAASWKALVWFMRGFLISDSKCGNLIKTTGKRECTQGDKACQD
jgi:hypothetical protein